MKENLSNKYRDIGVAASADEPRTSCLTLGCDGNYYLVICSRGFLLLINLNTKEQQQFIFPENYLAYPFGSIASKSGKIYLGAGTMFMEFDPILKEYTFYSHIHPDVLSDSAFCLTEDDDGIIYFGAHPKTYLTSFDPKTRKLTDYGILDDTQEYVETLAVDKHDYIYCSIGTQTNKIIAFNLKTKVKKVIPMPQGEHGGAYVCKTKNGEVYGCFNSSLTFNQFSPTKEWHRLENGEVCEKLNDKSLKSEFEDKGFHVIHSVLDERPKILYSDLGEHNLIYIHPETNEKTQIELIYKTDGADMSPLTLAPNGKIYGTTNHPIQIYTYDTQTDTLTNYGKQPFSKKIDRDAWGNICAYASQGSILGGCAYCGGYIVRIDTTKEIVAESGINPFHEATYHQIFRPRSAVAYSDGKTLIFGGFTLNGVTGGGLVLYDVESRKTRAIDNCDLVEKHSVMSMVTLPSGEVLCGTTIESPCGGYVYENEAVLFGLDIQNTKVLYQIHPIKNATEISHMKLDSKGIVHGITGESIYFAYNPFIKEVIKTVDLSEYGSVVRDGMQVDSDGIIYGLLTNGIYRIDTTNCEVEVISTPPCTITSGMAIKDGKIYFGSNTHLWSFTI